MFCYVQRAIQGRAPTAPQLRPECARFAGRYQLEAVAYDSWSSDPYCPETDWTGPGALTIGFYQIIGWKGGRPDPSRRPIRGCRSLLPWGSHADAVPRPAVSPRQRPFQALARRLAP